MTTTTTTATATATGAGTRRRRGLRALGAAFIAALAVAPAALAHGDPASHYLETDALYPSYARQPSQARQLELLGLLQAAERRGYPIKVALVAGPEDLVDDLGMLKLPQRVRGVRRAADRAPARGAGADRHAVRPRRVGHGLRRRAAAAG